MAKVDAKRTALLCNRSRPVETRQYPERVLHIIHAFGMGGAETWLLELLRTWRKIDANAPQIDFIATSGERGLFDDEITALGGEIYYLRYGRRDLLSFVRGFRAILKGGRYSVIHDHQGWASGWRLLMGCGLLPSIRIAHLHNPAYQVENLSLGRRLAVALGERLIGRYATHLGSTSRQLISDYGFDVPRFDTLAKQVLYCGFDPARFIGDHVATKQSVLAELGWPRDGKIALFAGRIDVSPDLGHPANHKNAGFAVEIGIECARLDPRFHLLLAGALSPAVPELERRISAAGLSGRIRFLGTRRDIERLMLGADALLFPSRSEGLGMVAVEAQASGLPVLASDAVPRECLVVPDLVCFKSVDAGASAWAKTLLELMVKPRLVDEANQLVGSSPFSIENSATALRGLYKSGVAA